MSELNVKAGDRVAYWHWDTPSIVTVDHVTPTGRIRVGTQQFRKNGRLIGGSGWRKPYIDAITPEIMERIDRDKMISHLSHRVVWAKLPTLSLKAIIAIVEANKPDPSEPA